MDTKAQLLTAAFKFLKEEGIILACGTVAGGIILGPEGALAASALAVVGSSVSTLIKSPWWARLVRHLISNLHTLYPFIRDRMHYVNELLEAIAKLLVKLMQRFRFLPVSEAPLALDAPRRRAADSDALETTYLYIPNNSEDAIRNIVGYCEATVKVAPPLSGSVLGKVTIIGSPKSQWSAQCMIFEMLRNEGFISEKEGGPLVEILVPKWQIELIFGELGEKVRDLEMETECDISLPDKWYCNAHTDDVAVHIFGAFFRVWGAQRRIRERGQVASASDLHLQLQQ